LFGNNNITPTQKMFQLVGKARAPAAVHNKQQQPITAADNSKNKKNKKKTTVEKKRNANYNKTRRVSLHPLPRALTQVFIDVE
jgi:hypothetical protein